MEIEIEDMGWRNMLKKGFFICLFTYLISFFGHPIQTYDSWSHIKQSKQKGVLSTVDLLP